jgi:hypothetical protein
MNDGYIALISAVIISVLLLTLTLTLSLTSFFTRFDGISMEFKKVSLDLARACSEVAILKISKDDQYTPPFGGEEVSVGDAGSCRIISVFPDGNHRHIRAKAEHNQAVTNLAVTVKVAPESIAVVNWAETPN